MVKRSRRVLATVIYLLRLLLVVPFFLILHKMVLSFPPVIFLVSVFPSIDNGVCVPSGAPCIARALGVLLLLLLR